MAKRLLYLAAGAFALTACTSSDVVDDVATNHNVIRFENVVSKPTRANANADLTSGNLQFFNVFGFYTMPQDGDAEGVVNEVFHNVLVSKVAGDWSHAGDDRYWVPGTKYYFYAYSCGNQSALSDDFGHFKLDMTGSKKVTDRTLEIDDYISDASHQHDLIFAYKEVDTSQSNYSRTVGFTFSHLLSRLQASFTTEFPKEYEVVIKNIRINNIITKADYLASTNIWSNFNETRTNTLAYLLNTQNEEYTKTDPIRIAKEVKKETVDGVEVIKTKNSEYSDVAYVIPYDYENDANGVNIMFDVDVYYEKDMAKPALSATNLKASLNPSWQMGYSYLYKINIRPADLNLEKISFNVDVVVDKWGDPSEIPAAIDPRN